MPIQAPLRCATTWRFAIPRNYHRPRRTLLVWLSVRKRESLVLTIDSGTAGMTVVQITSNGFRGKAAGRALQRQVSVPAGALGTGEASVLTTGGD